ncbi:MAG TPA: hypothetical protein VHO43_15590 [Ignavibacteriales bacterium]|nr:hypothetical protein [Ignavibacteriales bacterium]
MNFKIRLGVPDFEDLWNRLADKYRSNTMSEDERRRFNQIGKVMKLLSSNPRHNSLRTHEIDELSREFGFKVWQSYLENNTPAAGRLFWAYGPGKGDITILGYSPHPDEKKGAYKRIKLSGFPIKPE